MPKKKGDPEVWQGCEEDCFNCTYTDCKKPANEMKSLSPYERNESREARKRNRLREWEAAIDEALDELRM